MISPFFIIYGDKMDALELKTMLKNEFEKNATLSLELISLLKTCFLQQIDQWQMFITWRNNLIDEVTSDNGKTIH